MERPDPLTDKHEVDTVKVQQSSEYPGSFGEQRGSTATRLIRTNVVFEYVCVEVERTSVYIELSRY